MSLGNVDWPSLAHGPASQGRLDRIVVRLPDEKRSCPEKVAVSAEFGVSGDCWRVEIDPNRESQVTLLNIAVARAIAGEAEERLAEFGDNLLVNFDLSEENLPVGMRLCVGTVELEVTAEPHLGCHKFARRFGHEALRLVNQKDLRHLKLRGIHARVMRSGTVRLGDPVVKVQPE